MKKISRLISVLTILIVFNSVVFAVQAQVWRVKLYGCIQAGSTEAEVNLRDYLVNTRDPYLDEAIHDDVVQLDGLFGVRVSVYFPNDGLIEARFTPEQSRELILRDDGDPNARMTGTVLISLGFLQKEFAENNGSQMSVPAILAHEYAHAMQYANQFPFGEGVRKELHADFMAGWYVAHRCRCRIQDPNVAFQSMFRKGDARGFFDPKHHGTNQDRWEAMVAGYYYNFQANDGSAKAAYDYALRVVSR